MVPNGGQDIKWIFGTEAGGAWSLLHPPPRVGLPLHYWQDRPTLLTNQWKASAHLKSLPFPPLSTLSFTSFPHPDPRLRPRDTPFFPLFSLTGLLESEDWKLSTVAVKWFTGFWKQTKDRKDSAATTMAAWIWRTRATIKRQSSAVCHFCHISLGNLQSLTLLVTSLPSRSSRSPFYILHASTSVRSLFVCHLSACPIKVWVISDLLLVQNGQ